MLVSGIDCTECSCEKACEVISFEIQSSMATMRGVSLRNKIKDLTGKVQYAHDIYHRTDMSLFTETIRAFSSVTDMLERLIESIARTRRADRVAKFNLISKAADYLCEDLKKYTRILQDSSTFYDVLYGHEDKYLWDLLDKFITEFGLVKEILFQMPDGIETGQDRQMHDLIKNMKKTITPLMDIISTIKNQTTSTQYYKHIDRMSKEIYNFFPDKREKSASFVKLELLLSSLNESLDTTYLLTHSTKWLNDTNEVWIGTWKLYNDLRKRAKKLPYLENKIEEFSQKINKQTCNKALILNQLSSMDYYFEVAMVQISEETAFYLNVSQSYYKSTLSKQKVSEMINKQKIKSTINKVEFVEKMFIGNVTTPLMNSIDEFEQELLEIYSSSLSLMDKLQGYYETTEMFNSLARDLRIFYNPKLDFEKYIIRNESRSLWLPSHSIKDLRQVSRSSRINFL